MFNYHWRELFTNGLPIDYSVLNRLRAVGVGSVGSVGWFNTWLVSWLVQHLTAKNVS